MITSQLETWNSKRVCRPASLPDHGHGQRRAQQRGLQMRVAVAIVPDLLVAVVAARWDELPQHLGQIAFQPRFKLDGGDSGGAADVEERMPVCTPEAATTAATCSVKSCRSPWPQVRMAICR